MNWFNGSIPDAIQRSKQQKVVFIVYVYGWCNFLNFILLIRSDVISRSGGEGGCRQNFQVSLLIYQYLIFKCYCIINMNVYFIFWVLPTMWLCNYDRQAYLKVNVLTLCRSKDWLSNYLVYQTVRSVWSPAPESSMGRTTE